MAFSGALTLTDLNDFLTPSQACIKPVEEIKNPLDSVEPGAASTQIHIDSSGGYYEVNGTTKSSARKLETAQISLNDCLACSGCITSAESVLITLQSHEEVLSVLNANPAIGQEGHRTPVISISPQSLAAFAATLSSSSTAASSVTLHDVLHRVRAFCTQELNFEHVYDTTFARHVALLELANEFEERKQNAHIGGNAGEDRLPMLASACPGWVCYAEKTHSEMLPFISRAKSPQQIMGTLVKNWLAQKWGKTPNEIYHVTVMPCYDKKLEASRQDFYNDIYSTRDVDCVITTGELELLMKERGWDLSLPVPSEHNRTPDLSEVPDLITHEGSSSGSYLASLLSRYSSDDTELTSKTLRSSDYEEFTLTNNVTKEVIFKGARCYGFRNLQNVVRKVGKEAGVGTARGAAGRLANVRIKPAARGAAALNGDTIPTDTKGYDYVEVMACPSGCVNGGGQLKPPNGFGAAASSTNVLPAPIGDDARGMGVKWGNKEWTKRVEQAYWHDLPTPPPSPKPFVDESFRPTLATSASSKHNLSTADSLAVTVLLDLCKPSGVQVRLWSDKMDVDAERLRRVFFRTQYRAVESEVVGIQVKW